MFTLKFTYFRSSELKKIKSNKTIFITKLNYQTTSSTKWRFWKYFKTFTTDLICFDELVHLLYNYIKHIVFIQNYYLCYVSKYCKNKMQDNVSMWLTWKKELNFLNSRLQYLAQSLMWYRYCFKMYSFL